MIQFYENDCSLFLPNAVFDTFIRSTSTIHRAFSNLFIRAGFNSIVRSAKKMSF